MKHQYLSLVALDNVTFEQVHKISEILPWKKAPIAIYLLDEAQDLRRETSELVQVVLSNPDKHGYSQAAYETRLQDLENTVASQEVSVNAAGAPLKYWNLSGMTGVGITNSMVSIGRDCLTNGSWLY